MWGADDRVRPKVFAHRETRKRRDGEASLLLNLAARGGSFGPTAAPRSVSCARSGLHLRRFLVPDHGSGVSTGAFIDVLDAPVSFGLDSMELLEVYAMRVEEV